MNRLPWPVRSLLAGVAGTSALTLSYAVERRLRQGRKKPLDYDDSVVPGQIVANILDLPHVTRSEENELGLLLRWSYGSLFGLWHGLLRRRLQEPAAGIAFGASLMTLTLTMFPLLGHTPPPWRWPRGFLATSCASHAAYAAAATLVDGRLR